MLELHNDLNLPVSQGGFFSARNEYGILYIYDTSLRKLIPKHMKPIINRNNLTYGCKT